MDKHKKPLVVDGENASVEVATTDNGARITGDLEVTETSSAKSLISNTIDTDSIDTNNFTIGDYSGITSIADDVANNSPASLATARTVKTYVDANAGGTSYWHQIVSGYKINNQSTTIYYTFYRFWYENWANGDSSPTSLSDSDSYSCYFIAPRAGTITNIKIQGYATDTGATDPIKFYLYKAPLSNNEDSTTATSMGDTGTITPPAANKTFSHSIDISSSNTFAEDDRLFIWLKKDSNTGSQDLYFNMNISGEYS